MMGLGLLAVYAGIRLDGALQSRARLRSFEQEVRRPVAASRSLPDRPAQVDFALWSSQRIQQYHASLARSVEPPLAVLKIPRISLEVPVLTGTDELALNRGVGWIEGTAMPGIAGNIGIAGHRDGFFRGLKDLRAGDTLMLETAAARRAYVVDDIEIVTPQQSSVLLPRARPSLTLVTCYPFYYVGDAPRRYVVHASIARTESDLMPRSVGNSGMSAGLYQETRE